MTPTNKRRAIIAAAAALALSPLALLRHTTAHADSETTRVSTTDTSRAAAEMAKAAKNFWQALTPEQQAEAGFKFDDAERVNWHFIPKERKGLPLKDMTPPQKEMALALLSSGLSHAGFSRALGIMSLDDILKQIENGKGPKRDPENYYFSLFGEPGDAATWGWRFEGHHCALNFTIAGGKVAVAGPSFMGSNPAKVLDGPRKGLRVLDTEEDAGRALVKALDDGQQKKAIIDATAPKDILTMNSRKAMIEHPAGIDFNDLTDAQKKQLVALVTDYASRLRGDLAQDDLVKVSNAGWDKLKFAWAGPTDPGQGHYYRVQGPTFLIEYDCTQNNANHIHSVWRDLQNDFGDDILAKHYQDTKH